MKFTRKIGKRCWRCRSALISLSDLNDEGMRHAKSGAWWEAAPWRYMANISAVYEHRPSRHDFDAEWRALVDSRTGERGLFSRAAAAAQAARNRGRAAEGIAFGTNPCSEIILRPRQFCNLTEVRRRPCTLHARCLVGAALAQNAATATRLQQHGGPTAHTP